MLGAMDERLRELERRWHQSGAAEDEAALLKERVRQGDLAQDQFDAMLADARQAQASATESGEGVDLANKVVADLTAVGSELGLNVG